MFALSNHHYARVTYQKSKLCCYHFVWLIHVNTMMDTSMIQYWYLPKACNEIYVLFMRPWYLHGTSYKWRFFKFIEFWNNWKWLKFFFYITFIMMNNFTAYTVDWLRTIFIKWWLMYSSACIYRFLSCFSVCSFN